MTTSSITNDASTLFTEILTLLSEEKSFLADKVRTSAVNSRRPRVHRRPIKKITLLTRPKSKIIQNEMIYDPVFGESWTGNEDTLSKFPSVPNLIQNIGIPQNLQVGDMKFDAEKKVWIGNDEVGELFRNKSNIPLITPMRGTLTLPSIPNPGHMRFDAEAHRWVGNDEELDPFGKDDFCDENIVKALNNEFSLTKDQIENFRKNERNHEEQMRGWLGNNILSSFQTHINVIRSMGWQKIIANAKEMKSKYNNESDGGSESAFSSSDESKKSKTPTEEKIEDYGDEFDIPDGMALARKNTFNEQEAPPGTPRNSTSPRCSPTASPKFSPKTSPTTSPKASPKTSPKTTPKQISPLSSPQNTLSEPENDLDGLVLDTTAPKLLKLCPPLVQAGASVLDAIPDVHDAFEQESDEDTAGLEPATIVPLPIVTKAPKEPFPEDFPDDIDDLPDYPEDMPAISEPRKHYHVPPLPLSSPPPQPATQQPPKPSPQPQLMHLIKPPVPTLIKPQLEATVGDSPSTQIESDVEIEEWSDAQPDDLQVAPPSPTSTPSHVERSPGEHEEEDFEAGLQLPTDKPLRLSQAHKSDPEADGLVLPEDKPLVLAIKSRK